MHVGSGIGASSTATHGVSSHAGAALGVTAITDFIKDMGVIASINSILLSPGMPGIVPSGTAPATVRSNARIGSTGIRVIHPYIWPWIAVG